MEKGHPKKNTISPVQPAKHGVHDRPDSSSSQKPVSDLIPADVEDPLTDRFDPEVMPWESEEERTLRDESEDPDAPRSL
jgi:hypothetical protein